MSPNATTSPRVHLVDEQSPLLRQYGWQRGRHDRDAPVASPASGDGNGEFEAPQSPESDAHARCRSSRGCSSFGSSKPPNMHRGGGEGGGGDDSASLPLLLLPVLELELVVDSGGDSDASPARSTERSPRRWRWHRAVRW